VEQVIGCEGKIYDETEEKKKKEGEKRGQDNSPSLFSRDYPIDEIYDEFHIIPMVFHYFPTEILSVHGIIIKGVYTKPPKGSWVPKRWLHPFLCDFRD